MIGLPPRPFTKAWLDLSHALIASRKSTPLEFPVYRDAGTDESSCVSRRP